ncbi:hypothetical protein QLH52_24460 [Methylomonas sp. OY6]|uniref:Uncharacterized protein n=1 Tax=Methylomonas defluvii TaxID=3045149 RepID=A0ABU4ULU3_9GAMM|nr:hypothetical protein [Methylomonas sp. OY6]MDX8130460.1 hypothetical protein [Methylomonas sp. OY6]
MPKPRTRTEKLSSGTAESFGCTLPGYKDIHKVLGGTLQAPVRTSARLVGTYAGLGCADAPLGGNHERVLRAARILGHWSAPGLSTRLFDGTVPPTPARMNSTENYRIGVRMD